ncbi:pilin [Micromonospora costi]|uniref:pilin n=1 Tax=Micromonospora costi TaxID=1530042 RepID=UPI00406BB72D
MRALIHQRTIRLAGRVAAASAPVALSLSVPAAAYANTGLPISVAANSLPVVIGNLQTWPMGILAALATLFLVLTGVYWATAGGDPVQVEKAKGALKNALVGYGLAVLAPVLLDIVQSIVEG